MWPFLGPFDCLVSVAQLFLCELAMVRADIKQRSFGLGGPGRENNSTAYCVILNQLYCLLYNHLSAHP